MDNDNYQPTGKLQILNSYLEQLSQSQTLEEPFASAIREMGERMLSASMGMASTGQSTSDQMRTLMTIWENALKPGELTIWHYGLLSAALNSVDAEHVWTAEPGKKRGSIRFQSVDRTK